MNVSTLVEFMSIGEGDSDFKFLHRGRMMPSNLSMSSWGWRMEYDVRECRLLEWNGVGEVIGMFS